MIQNYNFTSNQWVFHWNIQHIVVLCRLLDVSVNKTTYQKLTLILHSTFEGWLSSLKHIHSSDSKHKCVVKFLVIKLGVL